MVNVYEVQRGWCRVNYNDELAGWCIKDCLKAVETPEGAPADPQPEAVAYVTKSDFEAFQASILARVEALETGIDRGE